MPIPYCFFALVFCLVYILLSITDNVNSIYSIDIDALEHSYQQADCYRRRSNERLRLSQFASSIFFLQNEAGAQKWPVTDEIVDSIVNSFNENLPPESEIEKMREKGLYIPKSQRDQMKDEVAADDFFNEWLKDI